MVVKVAMLRVVLLFAASAMIYVGAMPNVVEFDMKKTETVASFIKTKQDLIDFITMRKHEAPTGRVKLTGFSYKDCGGPSAMININSLSVTPDPLAFPGPLNIAASFKINSDVGNPLPGDVQIFKKILGKEVKIPCIDNFGSCHYDDLCELMEQVQCPDPLVKIGIDCTCPLKANSYTLPQTEFDVDASVIPAGDYHFIADVKYMGKEAVCLDLTLTFE